MQQYISAVGPGNKFHAFYTSYIQPS